MPSIDVNGISVHFSRSGDGAGILFLHSGPGRGSDWRAIIAEMEANYLCLAPDLLFRGETGRWPNRDSYGLDRQAEVVAAVIETTTAPIHLVGHSYGGAVALRCAVRWPERLRTLTLIEPAFYNLLRHAGEMELFAFYEAAADEFNAFVKAGDEERAWQLFIDRYNGPGAWRVLPEKIRTRILGLTEVSHMDWEALLDNPTTLDDLRRIRIPTKTIVGGKTLPQYRRICELVSELIVSNTLTTLHGANHMSPLTHPYDVAGCIRQHIQSSH